MIGITLVTTGSSYEEIANLILFDTRKYLGVIALSYAGCINILFSHGTFENV